MLLTALLLAPGTSWADDSDPWPQQVYFPQRSDQAATPATAPAAKKNQPASGQILEGAPISTDSEKKHWHFRKKEKAKDAYHAVPPKPSAEQADPPASPYPLLRLPMPIITDQGIVQPGIYLIKTEVSDPKIGSQTFVQKAPKAVITAEKPLLLTRQNQVFASIPIHTSAMPDEDTDGPNGDGPITKVDPKLPDRIKVEAELSDDQKTIHLLITNGKQHYESDEYAVGVDLRHKLTF